MDIQEIRRANLRKLIETRGGVTALGHALGYTNGSYLLQMAGTNPMRPVTERNARKFEATLELPEGWLDREDVAQAPMPQIDSGVVRDAITMTAKAVEKSGVAMPPTKVGDIAWMVYEDAVSHGGKVRAEYIEMIVRLMVV
jgi:hypothetical protein